MIPYFKIASPSGHIYNDEYSDIQDIHMTGAQSHVGSLHTWGEIRSSQRSDSKRVTSRLLNKSARNFLRRDLKKIMEEV
jgi:hypothetical protein